MTTVRLCKASLIKAAPSRKSRLQPLVVADYHILAARQRIHVRSPRFDCVCNDLGHFFRALRVGQLPIVRTAMYGVESEIRAHDARRNQRNLDARMRFAEPPRDTAPSSHSSCAWHRNTRNVSTRAARDRASTK